MSPGSACQTLDGIGTFTAQPESLRFAAGRIRVSGNSIINALASASDSLRKLSLVV
jgi:hypothetical protein